MPALLGHDHHDHDHCRDSALSRVEARCQRLGLRLTAQRRQVLDILLSSHVPVSAYDIMDDIGRTGRRPSPISVYRALDFLVANRFAHRIESRNAFLACAHTHEGASEPTLVFLLCDSCGAAAEAEPPQLTALLEELAARAGFQAKSSVLEIRGICRQCAGKDPIGAPTPGDLVT